jgi:hypothetical protein
MPVSFKNGIDVPEIGWEKGIYTAVKGKVRVETKNIA